MLDSRDRVELTWRGGFSDAELNALHAEGFGHLIGTTPWWERVNRNSVGWVTARSGPDLVGFVNVAWDGGAHAFLLDTIVATTMRRAGSGERLVRTATAGAKAAGCDWLHVDYEDRYSGFYLDACGFRLTRAGLIALRDS